MAGILYLVATPIGNLEDITQRALRVLGEVDLVVYEERKEGARLLRHFKIEKPVESLNEHNESASTHIILENLKQGKSVALVSDAGTPVFSDPGQLLVRKATEQKIRIVPVPRSIVPDAGSDGFRFSHQPICFLRVSFSEAQPSVGRIAGAEAGTKDGGPDGCALPVGTAGT